MSAEADDLRILQLHKTWADRYTLPWHLMILLLFVGAYFVLRACPYVAHWHRL